MFSLAIPFYPWIAIILPAFPGFWEPELDTPTAEEEASRLKSNATSAANGLRAQLEAAMDDIASPFRKPIFAWFFVYFLVIGVNIQVV